MSGPSIRGPRAAGDVVLVGVLVVLSLVIGRELFANSFNPVSDRHLDIGVWVAVTLLAALGLFAGRRWVPELGVVMASIAAVLHTWGGWPLMPADLLAVTAVFVAAKRRSSMLAVASVIFAIWAAYVATGQTVAGYRSRLPDPLAFHGGFPAIAAVLCIAWFLGAAERTMNLRVADAQRERDLQAARATQQERARIRREIHDIVAHGLSVIVVQAQGAAAALDRHPDRTAEALEAIVTTGRSALGDMRRLLDDDGAGASTPLPPTPGLEEIDQLIGTTNASGLPTILTVEGIRHSLPPDVDIAAYRIIQEALTNALRHAGNDARARVHLTFDTDSLEVQVTDTGIGQAPSTNGGHGLDGIRERAALLGGSVRTGNASGRGFEVHASLPLRPSS
jgi:signal transduction histidine kinase